MQNDYNLTVKLTSEKLVKTIEFLNSIDVSVMKILKYENKNTPEIKTANFSPKLETVINQNKLKFNKKSYAKRRNMGTVLIDCLKQNNGEASYSQIKEYFINKGYSPESMSPPMSVYLKFDVVYRFDKTINGVTERWLKLTEIGKTIEHNALYDMIKQYNVGYKRGVKEISDKSNINFTKNLQKITNRENLTEISEENVFDKLTFDRLPKLTHKTLPVILIQLLRDNNGEISYNDFKKHLVSIGYAKLSFGSPISACYAAGLIDKTITHNQHVVRLTKKGKYISEKELLELTSKSINSCT